MLLKKLSRPRVEAEIVEPIDLDARIGATHRSPDQPPAADPAKEPDVPMKDLPVVAPAQVRGSTTTGSDDRGRPHMIGAQEALPAAPSAATKIGELARRTRNPGELLENATSQLAELFDADGVSIMLADDAGHLSVHSSVGLSIAAKRDRKRRGEGISGYVAQSGQPLLLSGPLRDPRFAGNDRSINESIVAPLLADDRTIGVVNVKHRFRSGAVWARAQVESLSRVATEIARAFVAAQAMERVEDDRRQALVLYELSRLATFGSEPRIDLESAAAMLGETLGHDVVGVWVLEPSGGLRLRASRGYGITPLDDIPRVAFGPLLQAALTELRVTRAHYPDGDPTRPTWASQHGTDFLIAPIGSCANLRGVLVLGRWSAGYTQSDVDFAAAIGEYLSGSVQKVTAAESSNVMTLGLKRHIAQEIHDGMVQELTAVVRDLEGCQRAFERDPSSIGPSLARAVSDANATLGRLRQLTDRTVCGGRDEDAVRSLAVGAHLDSG